MKFIFLVVASTFALFFGSIAQSSLWDLSSYQPQAGLVVRITNEMLEITWEGGNEEQLQIRFDIVDSTPVIAELSVKPKDKPWQLLASQLISDYHVVSGVRRVTQQQTSPLEQLGIPRSKEKLDEIKWDAFWDAPLYIDDEPPKSHQTAPASGRVRSKT